MVDGMYTLTLDGLAATELGAHSAPEWETLADGGCGEIKWSFLLSANYQHPMLMRGTAVELAWGSWPVWSGRLRSYDKATGEAIGEGWSRQAYDLLALDGSGNTTRDVAVAVTQAIARGWQVTNYAAVSGTVAGTSTDPMTVGALLDARAKELGQRWGVNARRELYMRADPTVPTYQTLPASAVLSPSAGEWPTHFAGRFFDGASYVTTIRPSVATVGGRRQEEPVDLTDRGTLTLAQANAILDGTLATVPKVGWAQGLTLSRTQLRTTGDVPAPLMAVEAGPMLRSLGVLCDNGVVQGPYADVVIGRTRYTAGASDIQVDPVGLETWNFADALAAS